MTSYLDEQLNEYENAEVASFFNFGAVKKKNQQKQKKKQTTKTKKHI